jgi:hypothetical protein
VICCFLRSVEKKVRKSSRGEYKEKTDLLASGKKQNEVGEKNGHQCFAFTTQNGGVIHEEDSIRPVHERIPERSLFPCQSLTWRTE